MLILVSYARQITLMRIPTLRVRGGAGTSKMRNLTRNTALPVWSHIELYGLIRRRFAVIRRDWIVMAVVSSWHTTVLRCRHLLQVPSRFPTE